MNNKKKIGITGGIGAGKSFICKILSTLGYPIFYSDIEAKRITNSDPAVRAKIIDLFGNEAYYDNDLGLNRPFIAQQVFGDEQLLQSLNQIVHPSVQQAFVQFFDKQTAPLVFNEAAILFETGSFQNFDANVLVTAPIETRIHRVLNRDHISRKEVESRISKQWSDEKKIPLADFVINNDEQDLLLPQVLKMTEILLE